MTALAGNFGGQARVRMYSTETDLKAEAEGEASSHRPRPRLTWAAFLSMETGAIGSSTESREPLSYDFVTIAAFAARLGQLIKMQSCLILVLPQADQHPVNITFARRDSMKERDKLTFIKTVAIMANR